MPSTRRAWASSTNAPCARSMRAGATRRRASRRRTTADRFANSAATGMNLACYPVDFHITGRISGQSVDRTKGLGYGRRHGTTLFLMGNEAIGYGAVRAGAGFACRLPGHAVHRDPRDGRQARRHPRRVVRQREGGARDRGRRLAGRRAHHRQHEARRPQRGRRPAAHAHRDRRQRRARHRQRRRPRA